MGKTASLRTQDSPVESDIDKAAFDVQPTDASLTKLPVGDSHVDHGEDPLSEFSKKEISRAWLKVDLHILPVAVLLYLSSYIDRANVANAKVLGMGAAINLSSNQYNLSLSIFFVAYVLFETPSNVIIKRTSPRIYISTMTVLWGLICCLISLVKTPSQLIAARFFLGFAESGFLPGIILWVGSWYPRPMQGRRFSILYCTVSLTGAFGGLLATAINNLDGRHGIPGWRWIFIVEGVVTIGLGLLAFLTFSSSPTTSRWLTPREQRIILLTNEIDRALRADEAFSASQIKSAFVDWRTYIWGLMYFTNYVPVYSVVLSLPVVVTGLGYKGTTATLMAVWPYFAGFTAVVIAGRTLDLYGHRFIHYCIGVVVAMIALIVLISVESLVARYVMFFFMMFMFIPISTMWSWLAQNVAGSNKRAAATGLIFSMGNIGGIVAGQIYRSEWAPRYVQGHAINLACYVVALISGTVLWLSYKRDNAARDRAAAGGLESGASDFGKTKGGMLGVDLGDLGDRDPRYRYYL